MNDKFAGGVVATSVAAPVVLFCCLGGLAWIFGWLNSLSPLAAIGLALVGAFVVCGIVKRRARRIRPVGYRENASLISGPKQT